MAEEYYGPTGGGGAAGAFTAGASTGGNTAGTTGTVNNGVLFFGGANITLSESSGAGGASLSIVGGAGGAFSGGVSSGGNSAGTTGTVGNGIRFFGGNSITLSQSSAAGGATISVVGPSAWSQSAGMSNLGNTSGTSGIASGSAVRFLFAGGNNITLSQSINGASGTITISQSQPAQTGISGIAGSAASTVTAGTLVFANSNSMSFGLNGSTMTGSFSVTNTAPPIGTAVKGVSSIGSTGTVTRFAPEDHQHAGVFSFGVSSGGNTSGNTTVFPGQFVLAGGNNITLSQVTAAGNLATITISGGAGGAFTGGVSTQGNTSGTTGTVNNGIVFVGGNNITLSQSSGAGGATVTISAPSGGGIGVSSGGNTAGTTGTVDFQMVFVGSNNITLSQSINGSSGTLSIIGASGGAGFSAGMSTGGNTAGTAGTVDHQVVFVGGTNITLSQSQNASSATITIIGASGGGAGFTAGLSTGGNTSGDATNVTGRLIMAGSNNITLSGSTNAGSMSITISGPTGGGAGMGSTGNTFGTSGTVGAQLYFYGGNQISLSQSTNGGSGSLTISGRNAQTGISGIAGSAASTVTNGTIQFANANGISFGLNGSTMTASYTQSVPPLRSQFFFVPEGPYTSSQLLTVSWVSFQKIQIPYDVSFSRVDVPILVSLASSGTNATGNLEISSALVIYSLSGGTKLNPITGSFGTTTHTWASNSANFSSLTGGKFASFGISTSLSAGPYVVGFQMSTANNSSIGATTTLYGNTISLVLGSIQTVSNFTDFASTLGNSPLISGGIRGATMTATNQTQDVANINSLGVSRQQVNFPVYFRNY